MSAESGNRYALDANILFYSIDPADPHRHRQAGEIIERGALEFDCLIPLQAFCEFFASTLRKGKLEPTEAQAQIADWQTLFPTVYAGPRTLNPAIDAVRRHNFSFWDAMLWSTAREAGATVLLTEDFQHGRELGGVRFHNPFRDGEPFRV
jgi:predicted nucleic acid-binding protein